MRAAAFATQKSSEIAVSDRRQGRHCTTQRFCRGFEYLPPKVEGQKHGSDPIKGQVIFDKEKKAVEFQNEKGQQIVSIPYDKIKSILYEKTSRPRYAEAILISPFFLFSKTKKHFLTFQYTDEKGEGKFVMLHLDKSNAMDIVNTAEADTGQKVSREEER